MLLKGLNKDQEQSVLETEGYVRIIAGAGSGKTRVLSHRYAHLVSNLGISTKNILCVTFTNKAAQEMRKRIRNLIGDYDTAYIATFHGFCVTVLREDISTVNYPKQFIILDNEDKKTILRKIYDDCKITQSDITFTKAIEFIDKNKNIEFLINFNEQEVLKKYNDYKNKDNIKEKILYGYLYEQKKSFGLDFNDLISFTLHIFKNNQSILKKWQERLQYIMVDEFQDVSRYQYGLVKLLSDYHKNLFIVGDPDQTIYSWRGAKPEYIIDFDKFFPNSKTFFLNKNYRSTPEILGVANSLISKNKDRIPKDLSAIKSSSTPVVYNHLKTSLLEANWVANEIKTLLQQNISVDDIAILYRAHYVSRSLEEALLKEKIPYSIYSGISFYERKEIKDVLSYLRFSLYKDDISFSRIINTPKRNIGKKKIEFLQEYANRNNCSLFLSLKQNINEKIFTGTKAKEFLILFEEIENPIKNAHLTDILEFVLLNSGYEEFLRNDGEQERLDNLAELKQSIIDYENHCGEKVELSEYLQQLSLLTNSDKDTDKSSSVKLMTIHTAKGLEFPYVFVCALSEGIFPSHNVKTNYELEEERRLAYVAFTRAQSKLYLSDAEGFNFDDTFRYPSRFLFDIDSKLITFITKLEKSYKNDALRYIDIYNKLADVKHSQTYKIGEEINHNYFGKGKIQKYNINDDTYVVIFEKFETPRTIKLIKRINC